MTRKTHLTESELREFRELLLAKRHDLVGDVRDMDSAVQQETRDRAETGQSNAPTHLADAASDTYEQELSMRLIRSERGLLAEVDAALKRIEQGTYGICQATGKEISKGRLRAQPWAKFCLEHARSIEKG